MKLKENGDLELHTRDQGRGEMFYNKLWHEYGEHGGVWIMLQCSATLLADSGLKIVEMTDEEKANPFYPKVIRHRRSKL